MKLNLFHYFIILAAGKGTRLNETTENLPKGMIEIFGKTLIERQIEIYNNCGINDITIVTGYKNEKIKYSNVDCIFNQNFDSTNINESLFCASKKFKDSVIISYTDIIFEQQIIFIINTLKKFPKNAHPMDVTRTAVSILGLEDKETKDNSPKANLKKVMRIFLKMPVAFAAFYRAHGVMMLG